METSQFEGKKIAMKQTKEGFVLSLAIHPDDLPDELMRDFVGARYMVVMVRLNDDETPMQREPVDKMVSIAGMLCRDPAFWEFLHDKGDLYEKGEKYAVDWLCNYLGIESRKDIKNNTQARQLLTDLNEEFKAWKN